MAKPIVLKNTGTSSQNHDVIGENEVISIKYLDLQSLISTDAGNEITIGSDGKLYIPLCDGVTPPPTGGGPSGGSGSDDGSGSDSSGGSSGDNSGSDGGGGSTGGGSTGGGSAGGGSSGSGGNSGSGGSDQCQGPASCDTDRKIDKWTIVAGNYGQYLAEGKTRHEALAKYRAGATNDNANFTGEVTSYGAYIIDSEQWLHMEADPTYNDSEPCTEALLESDRDDGYFLVPLSAVENMNIEEGRQFPRCIKTMEGGCATMYVYVYTVEESSDEYEENNPKAAYSKHRFACSSPSEPWIDVGFSPE